MGINWGVKEYNNFVNNLCRGPGSEFKMYADRGYELAWSSDPNLPEKYLKKALESLDECLEEKGYPLSSPFLIKP